MSSDPSGPIVQIKTGSRLHFGLLDTVAPFGGIGVMVEHPATEIVVRPAKQFGCDEMHQTRSQAIADRFHTHTGTLPNCRVDVRQCSPPHFGLGSGTQFALAVAEGIGECVGGEVLQSSLATKIADRGKRSAVGVHGYFHGGLIYEGHHDQADEADLNPIHTNLALPSTWCVGVFAPAIQADIVSGEGEVQRFAELTKASGKVRKRLEDLVVGGILPAVAESSFNGFAEAVQEYNRTSGGLFAPVQGGPFNGAAVSQLVDLLIERGGKGVGQSSWGPGVFVWFESMEEAQGFANELPAAVQLLALTPALNAPREIKIT